MGNRGGEGRGERFSCLKNLRFLRLKQGQHLHLWYIGKETRGYCWRIYFKVLGVLFLGAVSPAFLPSKKACGKHKFRHFRVRQQYPPVMGAVEHLSNNAIGQCTETRSICSAQITPPARTFLESMRTRGSCSHNGKATDRYDSGYQLWVTEHTGYRGTLRQPPLLKAWHTHANTLPGGADF